MVVRAPPEQPPVELTSFVGRREQIADLVALVAGHRLVTVTGPGGCGKTRLAIEVLADARDLRQEVVGWVDLASVDEPAAVAEATAAALRVPVSPAGGARAALTAGLQVRRLLVCFDNCEHVVEAVGDLIEELLRACPDLSILATSREPLGSSAEQVWRVPPMDDDDVVALFVDRARAARADFDVDEGDLDVVRTICRRLDGIPLAIEFAAAWVRSLTPNQIANALDDRFAFLVGSHRRGVPRQRTLRTSLEWSYNLLRDEARILLPRLSVFAGPFTVDDVTAVCSDERLDAGGVLRALARLVDTSMIAADPRHGIARYRLSETIREFAADLLADVGETAVLRDRHVGYFCALAEALAVDLDTGDQDAALARATAMDQNLRAALDWGLVANDPEAGRRLAAALVRVWVLRGRAREGIHALERAITRRADVRTSLQAQLLTGLAMLAMPAGRPELSVDAASRAVEMARSVGDVVTAGRATGAAGYVPFYTDYARCEELGLEAEEHGRAAGDRFAVNLGLLLRAVSLANRDRHDEVVPIADELYARAVDHHDRFFAFSRNVRLYGALLTGDVPGAVAFGRAAVELAEPLGDYFVLGTVTSDLAWAIGASGELDQALHLVERWRHSIDHVGPDVDLIGLRVAVGKLLLWSGSLEESVLWLQRAADFDAPGIDNWTAMRALPTLSVVLRRLGRFEDAAGAATRGIEMARRLGTPHAEAESLDALGHVVGPDDPGRAEALFHEALALRSAHGLWTHVADSLDAIARLVADRGDHAQAARLLGSSDRSRLEMGYPRPHVARGEHTAFEADVRDALGGRFEDLCREGATLGLVEAVAYATRARGPRGRPSLGWGSLTPTEREVVALVADGLTNPQIAERLFVSRATIKTHVSHVFAKLGVSSRAELAAAASRREDSK